MVRLIRWPLGLTLCGKNHFGSIKGTSELHPSINPNSKGGLNSYSPIVDLAASPNVGAKTILYVLDGLYCGRRWLSYPIHFPNPPFNNRVQPYENPEWPSCLLASLDGVALDSVGLDILYSQTKNNLDLAIQNKPRLVLRDNSDGYLKEMAQANQPPSGTKYMQDGKPVPSLGVFEHWDNDASRKYSRNLDPSKGAGIELHYLPFAAASVQTPVVTRLPSRHVSITCLTPRARIYYTVDGSAPTDRSSRYVSPFMAPLTATIRSLAMTDDLRDSEKAVVEPQVK